MINVFSGLTTFMWYLQSRDKVRQNDQFEQFVIDCFGLALSEMVMDSHTLAHLS